MKRPEASGSVYTDLMPDLHLNQIRPQACVTRKGVEDMLIPHGSSHARLPEDGVVSVVKLRFTSSAGLGIGLISSSV